MNHWNYRVVKNKDNIFSIREVYYNEDGNVKLWSGTPEALESDDVEQLKSEVEYILKAFDTPVLNEEVLKKEAPL